MEDTSLMFSDDRTIELTTQRILQHSKERTNQIRLEDFESFEFKTYHIGNYKSLVFIFLILTIITIIFNIQTYYSEIIYRTIGQSFWNYLWNGAMMKILTFFLFLSLLFFIISRRYFVRINGKFNSIEFRIISPYSSSVKNFLSAIVSQSEKVKKCHSQTQITAPNSEFGEMPASE